MYSRKTLTAVLIGTILITAGIGTAKAFDPFKGIRDARDDLGKQAEEKAHQLREERDRIAKQAEEKARKLREERDRIAKQAEEAARKARETRDEAMRRAAELERQAREQAAKVEEFRRKAQEMIDRFNKLRRDAESIEAEYKKYEKLAQGDSAQLREEAYRQLRKSGVMGSNKTKIKAELEKGLSFVLWAKEFDHFEEIKFATALGASVASGNPGMALKYVEQFALESKKEVLKNLKRAPKEVQRKVEKEFEKLFVEALDKAVSKGRPIELNFEGVTLTVGLATYNHWSNVKYSWPELVKTTQMFGVQLYDIKLRNKENKIPLPNTFQPYVRLAVKYSSK